MLFRGTPDAEGSGTLAHGFQPSTPAAAQPVDSGACLADPRNPRSATWTATPSHMTPAVVARRSATFDSRGTLHDLARVLARQAAREEMATTVISKATSLGGGKS
jgi:hypothetical protein